MKVFLTGATGQLGKEIIKQKPKGFDLFPLGREKLDLGSYNDCWQYIRMQKPDWIINAGAYTSVDKAEYQKALDNLIQNKEIYPLSKGNKVIPKLEKILNIEQI